MKLLPIILIAFTNGQRFEAVTELRHMWITPLQISSLIGKSVNIRNNATSTPVVSESFLQDFAFLMIDYFTSFSKDQETLSAVKLKYSLHEDASKSDLFYFYQLLTFQDILLKPKYGSCKIDEIRFKELKKKFLKVIELLEEAINHFCITNTISESSFNANRLTLWASIHSNGTFHQAHHHHGNSISGILYLQVPKQAGAIVFEDPRGSLPPFGKTHRIHPQVGDMIIFPSWLVHRVEPTLSVIPRVSLSFNYEGDWDNSGDINRGIQTA